NGKPVTIALIDRPEKFTIADGRSWSFLTAAGMNIYNAPNIKNPYPASSPYCLTAGTDPFKFSVRIDSLCEEGENTITFKDTSNAKPANPIVITSASVKLYTMPSAPTVAAISENQQTIFSVTQQKNLEIKYHGQTLIEKDFLSVDDGNGATTLAGVVDGKTTWNVLRQGDPQLNYRKEVVLGPSGIEMTLRADYNGANTNLKAYRIYLPLKLLDGATYKAVVGRASKTSEITGTINQSMPEKAINGQIRFFALRSDKVKLVFDFNPLGVSQMYTDYPHSGEPMGVAAVYREGAYLVIIPFSRADHRTGGLYSSKILIYEGEYDFEQKHPYSTGWTYSKGTPGPQLFLSFGTRAPSDTGRGDLKLFNSDRGYGWGDATGLELVSKSEKNIFGNCVFSPAGKPAAFSAVVRPGWQIATISCGHPTQDVGPFQLIVNGKVKEQNIKVEAGKTKTLVVSTQVRSPEDKVKLEFQGASWAVQTIAVQTYIQENEDFFVSRKLWVVPGLFEPDVGIKPEYSRNIKVVKPVKDPNANDWHRSFAMGNWCDGGHGATSFEFNTPELVEKRVKDLKDSGFTVINEGIFFWNLSQTKRWDEAIDMGRLIVDKAHKEGMKVMHHMDAPIVLSHADGSAYLLDHPEWLMRSVSGNIPTLNAMCLNNPEFNRELRGRIARYARETGVDAFMIDEVSYVDNTFCGCDYCRDAFTRATGMVLPRDPSSPDLQNMNSKIWRKWMQWRQTSLGDWNVETRNILRAENPNISILTYTTHYGLYSSYATLGGGGSIIEAARGRDFIGTEIMSRNVFDAWRSVYAFRKLFSAVGDLCGSNVYGLVYPVGDPNIAYFGWVLNHMNLQTTWMETIPGVDMKRYQNWPNRMKIGVAAPLSDVAVFFSSASKDFEKNFGSVPDLLAFSEIMTDRGIQNDFLVDRSLNAKNLSKYKTLVLASVGCLSAAEVAAVKEYVAAGGQLIMTANTSTQDELGDLLPDFALADVAGVKLAEMGLKGPLTIKLCETGEKYTFPNSGVKVVPTTAVKYADFVSADGSINPAITENSYGKGKCIYIACSLGGANYEAEKTSGDKWVFQMNKPLAELLLSLVDRAGGKTYNVQAVTLPEKVIVATKRQNDAAGKFILINLLNARGSANLKLDDVIPAKKPGDAFPALDSDVVLDIRCAATDAFIASPDYEGQRPVDVKDMNNGYVRITVKKEDVKAYSIVYLKIK
ncbi:MAG: beta-galactosidase trimerization domain-containing protein, partial [Verrucomicrobia bacterium]|nr:beta-galactosidase trimerization domain-containing protein [Verrucomicrobiota bacterium]